MHGLTSAQVAEAKTNDVPRRSSRSLSAIIRANVFTLFNLVIGLLWALILIFGAWQDGMFGLVIVANVLIGIVQELRAKRTLDRLAVVGQSPGRPSAATASDREIPPHQVVLGDLILLGPGDHLLVDGEVVAVRRAGDRRVAADRRGRPGAQAARRPRSCRAASPSPAAARSGPPRRRRRLRRTAGRGGQPVPPGALGAARRRRPASSSTSPGWSSRSAPCSSTASCATRPTSAPPSPARSPASSP